MMSMFMAGLTVGGLSIYPKFSPEYSAVLCLFSHHDDALSPCCVCVIQDEARHGYPLYRHDADGSFILPRNIASAIIAQFGSEPDFVTTCVIPLTCWPTTRLTHATHTTAKTARM